jgi:hypothetical protein
MTAGMDLQARRQMPAALLILLLLEGGAFV